MRRGLTGLAIALGVGLATTAPVGAEDREPMRFVIDPTVINEIDPALLAGQRSPKLSEPAQRGGPPGPPLAQAAPATTQATTATNISVSKRPPSSQQPAEASWPVTLNEVRERQELKASGKIEQWQVDEVKAAQASCAAILKRIDAVAVIEDPLKDGECGTPAPVRLVSIGKKPEVVLSPPALVTCEMAEALHTWIKQDLQPMARKHLGGPVIKIEKMSDYSCRNAYGRAKGRLSEHGRANALDIAGFTTARGESTTLLADWGMTARDIRRQVAAAKANAIAAEAKRVAAEQQARQNARSSPHHGSQQPGALASSATASVETGTIPPAALGVSAGAPAGGIARASIIEGIPRVTVSIPGASSEPSQPSEFSGQMSRLGGPPPVRPASFGTAIVKTAGSPGPAVDELRKQRFLRGAHESACKIFGTVLGPEANNAHRNHFHIDMATRGATGAFCQ